MATRRARVLVAEDDDGAREALSELLRDEGFEVACATNGRDALALAKGFQPDVVVSDLEMPIMGGVELFRSITATDADTGTVVMSARPYAGEATDAFVPKPISLDELLAAIDVALTARMRRIAAGDR